MAKISPKIHKIEIWPKSRPKVINSPKWPFCTTQKSKIAGRYRHKPYKTLFFLFLSVTQINPCLKQQRYQKKLQVTHSNDYAWSWSHKYFSKLSQANIQSAGTWQFVEVWQKCETGRRPSQSNYTQAETVKEIWE